MERNLRDQIRTGNHSLAEDDSNAVAREEQYISSPGAGNHINQVPMGFSHHENNNMGLANNHGQVNFNYQQEKRGEAAAATLQQ